MPIKTNVIDLERLELDRDQLWAEAIEAYRSGEKWWLTGRAVEAALMEQAERGEDDPWISTVRTFVEAKEAVSCKLVLANAFYLPADKMGQRETKRIAKILRISGFERDGQFTSGDEKGQARYVRKR